MRNVREIIDCGMRLLAMACVMILFAGSAFAYTIILRGGRRIEIPAQFVVTKTTLTYELSPGFQKTLQMAAIDVAATEQANGEQPGSLLHRVNQRQPLQKSEQLIAPQVTVGPKALRSITNRDLESYARSRRESEVAFDQRQKELGQPSLAEIRERNQAEVERIRVEFDEQRQRAREEDYWRAQSEELKAELAAVSAELTGLQERLNSVSPFANTGLYAYGAPIWPFAFSTGFEPGFGGFGDFNRFGNFNRFGFGHFPRFRHRNVFVSPKGVVPLTARTGFRGGPVRGRVFVNPGGFGRVPRIR